MRLGSVEERGRFPATPLPFVRGPGGSRLDPAQVAAQRAESQRLRAELRRRMEETGRREVVVFVHGYNNDFSAAAFTLAELWHFLGREPVPLLYTWPAGHGGPSGYAYDRESGEFTVFHLKQLLRELGSFDEIDALHLVAHSRGTDVTTTALRELFIEARAAGLDFRNEYRIANLLLAAPDLDVEVMGQRLIAEDVATGIGRITIYTSADDKALAAARDLFGSALRLGAVTPRDLPAEVAEQLAQVGNVSFVEMRGRTGFLGHGYFHSHAGASSDLVLVIRYGRDPGAENGRPLEPIGPRFWAIDDAYPGAAGPASEPPSPPAR
jgi:esterase/lipase superfamily enzyme